MKNIKSLLVALAVCAAPFAVPTAVSVTAITCAGCASVWQTTVTLTETIDSAAKEYAHVYNQGLVSAAVDAKVTEAHAAYQKFSAAAASALRAYKLSGDKTQYDAAFAEAIKAANQFVNLIVPFLTNAQGTAIKTNLSKASSL